MSILILVVISILTSSIILILKMHPLSFLAHSRLSRSRIFKTHQQGHLFHLHSGPGRPGMGRPNSYSSMWGQCGALFNVTGGWIKDMPTSHLSLFLSLFCVAPPPQCWSFSHDSGVIWLRVWRAKAATCWSTTQAGPARTGGAGSRPPRWGSCWPGEH